MAKIQASDKEASDQFGGSVSISGDRAIVGAHLEDTGGSDAGAAYIFERSSGVWSEAAKIQASDIEATDFFGRSVSISGDRATVGASSEDTGGSNAGAAYIFERNTSGVWSEVTKIQASDKQADDKFGESVSISGERVIVGAFLEDASGLSAGAAYIFEYVPNQAPTANAGTDQSVCTSTGSANVILDGSASSDPDSNPLTYTWKEGATTLATGENPTVSLNLGTHMIDLTVDDGNGGTDTDQVVVAVRAAPVVTVSDASTCAGGSATITANVSSGTAPFSYAWTVPGGAINPGNVASFSGTVAGNYAVVVTDANSCTGSDNGDLTVNPNPTADAGADATIFTGSSITIGGSPTGSNGTGAFTIAWTPTDGLSDASSANPTAGPAVTTTYTVTVTNENGCEATDDVTVAVQSPEEATEEIIGLVDDLGLPQGMTNSLTAKLDSVIVSLQNGNTAAALNQLNAFINQCNAQRGKKLTEAQADLLIAEAQRIINAINAGSLPKLSSETTPTSVPAAYQLEQNYPNPFNPSTAIRFSLPEAAQVKLTVYDINGREVRSLVSGSLTAGEHNIQWDAVNNNGAKVASGIYIYRLQAGSFTQTRKMTLLR